MSTIRVLEKFYTAKELSWLVGFNERYWRDRMKADPQLLDGEGRVISQCVEISGEFFAPASWVNAYVARTPVTYDAGIKARNRSELERKLRKAAPPAVCAA